MKKWLTITLCIVLALIILGGTLWFFLNKALDDAAKLHSYDFDGDKIPSLTSVVGERKVTGVSSSSNTSGSQQKEYTYNTQTLEEDINVFAGALKEEGFLQTTDMAGNFIKGGVQYGLASVDEGKILLIDLSWDNSWFAVKITKGDGTITPK